MSDKTQSQTVVGSNSLLSGRIESTGDVVVFGRIEGELDVQAVLFIEQGALVKAEARVRHAVVSGRFEGTIRAVECVEVGPTGVVCGRIVSPRLVVADGGKLEATLAMSGEKVEPTAATNGGKAERSTTEQAETVRYSYRIPEALQTAAAKTAAAESTEQPEPAGAGASETSGGAPAAEEEVMELWRIREDVHQ